jgi:hypothetical protein
MILKQRQDIKQKEKKLGSVQDEQMRLPRHLVEYVE